MLPSGDVLLHYFKKQKMNTISNDHILWERVEFVQRNLRILLEKEKERLCGGILTVSTTLHARVFQIVPHKAKLFVNIGSVFCADFFFCKFLLSFQ
jgi:hypothetical protein